jgi:hypothetical protein
VEYAKTGGRALGPPTVSQPYKKPPPDFPYRVCGTHPSLGYVEYGIASRKNVEERAEALRNEGFHNVKVHERGTS